MPEARQREILASLGFTVEKDEAVVPSWRPDVDGPADLVEEVTRIHGYEAIASAPLERKPGVAHPTATRAQLVERRVRRTAATRGLDEAVTWSFIAEAEAAPFGEPVWRLMNPISEEMKVMRPSLLPGLIAAARRNIDRGQDAVRLFEVGRRYLADGERPTVAPAAVGREASARLAGGQGAGLFGVRRQGRGDGIARGGGCAGPPTCRLFADAGPTWHPGRSATLAPRPEDDPRGVRRAPSRLCCKALDAPAGAIAAEIYLDAIPAARSSGRARAAFTPPALQPVTRDFAFFVPADLAAETLGPRDRAARTRRRSPRPRLFDRLRAPMTACRLAIEVTLQPADKSFTDAEIGEISKRIVAAAEKLGAKLRG